MGAARGRRGPAPAADLSVPGAAPAGWWARAGARAGTAWLGWQRRRHRRRAAPLDPDALDRLAAYFAPETLAAARLRVVPRLDLPAPLRVLERLGLGPPDTGRLWGITFLDTILLSETAARDPARGFESLVHELVHVAQARHLGAGAFAGRYLAGWTGAGRRYRDIPLERDAREITARVLTGPPFPVEAEVARRLGGS